MRLSFAQCGGLAISITPDVVLMFLQTSHPAVKIRYASSAIETGCIRRIEVLGLKFPPMESQSSAYVKLKEKRRFRGISRSCSMQSLQTARACKRSPSPGRGRRLALRTFNDQDRSDSIKKSRKKPLTPFRSARIFNAEVIGQYCRSHEP